MSARRLKAALLGVAFLAVACTGGSWGSGRISPTALPSTTNPPLSLPTTPAAADPLCRARPTPSRPAAAAPAGSLPTVIAQVARQVEQVRNLTFLRPVPAEPVSSGRMAQLLGQNAKAGTPKAEVARTGKAWATIGAIPRGTDLYKALVDFDTSQVIGFYDPEAHRLVFIGSASPTPFQRFTLAHELTHALDDQRFDLTHLDKLQMCRDDEQGAYIALAEGDAVFTSVAWARQDLAPQELAQLQRDAESAPSPPQSVPMFLVDLLGWPYEAGPPFIQALLQRGGAAAVNQAFRHPPASTEQVLHPERFPSDRPVPVEVPNLATRLGTRWKEIEIEQVGEAWLQILFAQHMSTSDAEAATDHWGGGQYRAWSDGPHTVVLMDTVWDGTASAARFASGMRRWLGDRSTAVVVRTGPASVRVLFASDGATLASARRIVG